MRRVSNSKKCRDLELWSNDELDFAVYAHLIGGVKMSELAEFLCRNEGMLTEVVLSADTKRCRQAIERITGKSYSEFTKQMGRYYSYQVTGDGKRRICTKIKNR